MESSGARRSRRARPSRRRPLLCSALAAVAVVGATAGGTVYVRAQAHPGVDAVSSAAAPSPTASVSATEEESVEPVADAEVDRDALLAAAMGSVTVPGGAAVSVAVLDVGSGVSAAYGTTAFDTASIVKVDILAALLLRAQDDGRSLTAQEKAYATAMIENSDNDSASALWRIIGKAEGLDAANERFGLTETEGGDDMLWGLTRTTAADQLTLLRQVFGEDSLLSEASRTYLRTLMGRIAVGQRWGVSAVADGASWALKNGWLPRTATGLWDVNSIGRVTADGRDYLVAVLTNGNATQAAGITLVEAAARAAVSAFADGSASAAGASASASAATSVPATASASGSGSGSGSGLASATG
ncbi:serine hydrolase [Streptomyces sp. NPDC052015]|uniref:serine hydrolase n=1 Tax=Streptomyces sp. NPDC052015 TaxID=3154755 RepID=UPI003416172C